MHASPLAAEAVADRRRWTALVFIALAQLMVVLDATIVNIAMPSAQHALGISDGDRQGLGTTFMPAMNLATSGVRPQDAGVASAMVSTVQQVGGSIGTALLNTIAATVTATYLSTHTPSAATPGPAMTHGFTVALWWAAGILVLSAIAVLTLIDAGTPKAPEARVEEPDLAPELAA
ncbi:MAG: hypothetical protein GEV11_26985 [Streptosporangiales bacterium]|nr:hypothetical protein [Streptosporangiales bacterium]